MIRFAVVTVARDDREGFLRTRASLLAQTHRAWDWYVAEGGSRDGTAELVRASAWAAAWWRARPDGGPYAGMNDAAAAAAGGGHGYAVFMNAGDAFADEGTLARVAAAAEAAGRPGLVYGDAVEEVASGVWRAKRSRPPGWWPLGMVAQHQAMYFRSDLLGPAPYPEDYAVAADYALLVDVLARTGGRALRLGAPLCRSALAGVSRLRARDGRREQAEIRRLRADLPLVVRAGALGAQAASWSLRERWPSLHAALRHGAAARGGAPGGA